MKNRTHAVCTWGDGPDVLLVVDYDSRDPEALTAVEARRLAAELLAAADRADELARAQR